MKKIIPIVFILLVIALGLTPGVMGYYFKHHYLNLIAHFNLTHKNQIHVIDYQLGWRSSTVILRLPLINAQTYNTLPFSDANIASEIINGSTLTLEQHITHGPLVYSTIKNSFTPALALIQSLIHLPDKTETLLLGNTRVKGIGNIESLINFNNECQNRIQVNPLTLPVGDIGQLIWQGLTGDMYFKIHHDSVTHLKGHVTLGAINANLADPESNLELSLSSFVQDMAFSRQTQGLWTGYSTITLPSVIFKMHNETQLSLENLSLTGNSAIDGNNYNANNTLTIQSLSLPGNLISSISPLHYALSLKHLNVDELNKLMSAINALPSNANYMEERNKLYQTSLPRLLTPTSSATFDFSMNTNLGTATAKGEAYWPANIALPNSMDEVASHISGKINLRIAIPFANALVDQTITGLTTRLAQQVRETPLSSQPIVQSDNENKNKETFNNALTRLMENGQLSLSNAIQLMSLYDDHVPSDSFAHSISQLGLAPATESELNQIYTQLTSPQITAVTPTTSHSGNTQVMQQELSTSVKGQVSEWLQQGYLIKDNNDYIATLTYENKEITINGKPLPAETNVIPLPLPPLPQ